MSPILKFVALALAVATPISKADEYYNFIRQQQQRTNVVWDMPVAPDGSSPAALLVEDGGALFQLWTIEQSKAKDYLLDQKLVGAYLPKGEITIKTLDSYKGIPRIRVDQPFTVDFKVSNLIFGADVPAAASKVLAEHHLAPNPNGNIVITAAQAISGTPFSTGYIEQNGILSKTYPSSSIAGIKARGEEHFVLHALGDGQFSQTQIASAFLQVWPMADGTITGVNPGDIVRGTPPELTVSVRDLYPNSDTYLRIYTTGEENDTVHKIIPGSRIVLDQEFPASRVFKVSDYGDMIGKEGTVYIELLTKTPFNTIRLAHTHFPVERGLHVNAMLVDSQTSAP
ncbi:hypothetical protein ACFSSA_09675 [Luteolibacter algae]|uniref:Uncharacterized protein n=1 Tax=Luteolibacter algae TaxID=454151 RepID=A0ABW5DBY4_9BACT